MSGTQVYKVYIKADAKRIWEAITWPEWNGRYGYRGATELELRPGGAVVGRSNPGMIAARAPEIGVDGEVIAAEPPYRLVQTFRMLMDPGTAAEGFTRLTISMSCVVPSVHGVHDSGPSTGSMSIASTFAESSP